MTWAWRSAPRHLPATPAKTPETGEAGITQAKDILMALEVQPWTGLGAFGEQVGLRYWFRGYSVITASYSTHLYINDMSLGLRRLQTVVKKLHYHQQVAGAHIYYIWQSG